MVRIDKMAELVGYDVVHEFFRQSYQVHVLNVGVGNTQEDGGAGRRSPQDRPGTTYSLDYF